MTKPTAQVTLHTLWPTNILSYDIGKFIEALNQIGANDVWMLFQRNLDRSLVLE